MHQGENRIMNKINELKIYYKGISSDIKDMCEIFIKKYIILQKDALKQIIIKKIKRKVCNRFNNYPKYINRNYKI